MIKLRKNRNIDKYYRKILLNNAWAFIRKYDFQESFSDLLDNIVMASPTNFTDLSRRIAFGFKQYNVCVRYSIIPKLNQEVREFYCFIEVFKRVLEKCSPSDRIYLVTRFKAACKSIGKFGGLYHELRTIDKLLREPTLELVKLPEANLEGYPQGKSPPDAIFKANNLYFQLECKSISESKGHPIVKEALMKFLELLTKSEIYPTICPKEKYCHIEFSIDRHLCLGKDKYSNEEIYMPQTLLEQFKYELGNNTTNVIITCGNDNDVANVSMSEAEEAQALSVVYSLGVSTSIVKHRITLVSSSPNNFALKVAELIDNAIQKKRIETYPLILSLEIFEIHDHIEWSNIMQLLCDKYKDKMLWVILTSREDEKDMLLAQVFIKDRYPIEIRTKALSELLELNEIHIGEVKRNNL